MDNSINDKAKLLPPITLQEMSCIKLMNRTDTKFVATAEQLHSFLLAVQGKYFIQEIDGKRIASYHTTYFDTDDYQMYNMHHCHSFSFPFILGVCLCYRRERFPADASDAAAKALPFGEGFGGVFFATAERKFPSINP